MVESLTQIAHDPVTEDELHAFVDGQLGAERTRIVADYLSRHPDIATCVFSDINLKLALRDAVSTPISRRRPETDRLARRLQARLAWQMVRPWVLRTAAAVVLVALGWAAHWQAGAFDIAENDDAPVFIVDAVHAWRTSLQSAQARSENVEDLFARNRIAIPKLKQGWRLADALVYSSSEGEGVEATLSGTELGDMSLFAMRTRTSRSIAPSVARFQDQTTVYWQRGETFYALTARKPEGVMRSIAAVLARG